MHFVSVSLTLILFGAIGFVRGDGCYYTEWSFDDLKCKKGTTEIFQDVHVSGQSSRYCCNPKHKNFNSNKGAATVCHVTECGSGRNPDLCSMLDNRFVNGTRLEYEELMRVPCTRSKNRQGAAGYCCVKDSKETKLALQIGAEQNEFPHMAKLKLPGHCGGTIYNKRFVITAAHCIVDEKTGAVDDESQMQVILGTNIADINSKEYIYGVKRAIPHPEFTWIVEGESRLLNDVAVLELDRDIQFGPNVKALEIAPRGFEPLNYANEAVIVGWGTTDTADLSIHLQKVNVIIRTDKACFEEDDANEFVPWTTFSDKKDQLLCVGGIIEGKWSPVAEQGDSGGPAICRGADGKALLCGITSLVSGYSVEECLSNQDGIHCPPSLYAKVSHFHKWIKDNAGKQDPSTFYKPYLYGQPVPKGKYEHQVQITSSDGTTCGGTAISQDIVITSQHCIKDAKRRTRKGIKITTQKGKSFEMKKSASLPGFERMGDPVNVEEQGHRVIRTDNYYKNDIAIIQLNGKMGIPRGKLAELPKSAEQPDIAFEVSRPRNSSKPNELMQREFRILDKSECQTRLDRLTRQYGGVKLDKILMCGVETYSGGSQCDRDLGGGLICKGENGKDVLCGIQAFRLCEWSIPNGFINMGMFTDWAKGAMKNF